ncbi:MAG TPA: type VI secretion system-associated protein TagF, partial [Burkholderiaceae bacterium]
MATCGFYGKLPSEGDFVSRRLPWEFTSAWDDWLQQGMQASRGALGERWLELYLSAPVWRFQLAPGVCGPLAWRGLFFASVDRVGRYFPLTLAFAGGPGRAG